MRIRRGAVFLAAVCTAFVTAAPAQATNCGGSNCYATGYVSSGGVNWGGMSARWDTRSYTAPDWATGGFASEVLWGWTRSAQTCWAEIGYTHGWQGQNLRTIYYVDGCPYTEYRVTAYSAGSAGTRHVYTQQEATSTTYALYFDFNKVGTISETPWTRFGEVGLEATDRGATFPTTTVDAIQYRDAACCTGNWHSWPSSRSTTLEDRPPYDWTWTTTGSAGHDGRCGC